MPRLMHGGVGARRHPDFASPHRFGILGHCLPDDGRRRLAHPELAAQASRHHGFDHADGGSGSSEEHPRAFDRAAVGRSHPAHLARGKRLEPVLLISRDRFSGPCSSRGEAAAGRDRGDIGQPLDARRHKQFLEWRLRDQLELPLRPVLAGLGGPFEQGQSVRPALRAVPAISRSYSQFRQGFHSACVAWRPLAVMPDLIRYPPSCGRQEEKVDPGSSPG